ncbi:hypothetical protein [Flavobacterium sp.]|jgi:hypothetical protein|uniref:hypothetical protein n=1 Tax=Flavobacterium sp. TaxID=239 RepID=UPI0035B25104
MENIANNIELLYDRAEKYTSTSVKLLKLNAVDKTSDLVASLSLVTALIAILAIFSLFINIAISLYLGKILNDYALSFLIVSGFYLFIGILVFIFREKWIKIPIGNLIISKLMKEKTFENAAN